MPLGRCIHNLYRGICIRSLIWDVCLHSQNQSQPLIVSSKRGQGLYSKKFKKLKMQRKVVQFVGIFKNVSVVFECFFVCFVFLHHQTFMEKKRKKLNAQRWCYCNDLCKLLYLPFPLLLLTNKLKLYIL